MSRWTNEDELKMKIDNLEGQVDLAIRALHVIAVLTEAEPGKASQLALDYLKEMEIDSMRYTDRDDYYDDYGE